MTDPTYARAIASYQASSLLDRSPVSVAMALHQKLYAAVSSARFADEQNRLDEMSNQLQTASMLVSALMAHMNFDLAGSDGRAIADFYAATRRRIRKIGMCPKNERDWVSVTDPIRMLLSGFMSVSKRKQTDVN